MDIIQQIITQETRGQVVFRIMVPGESGAVATITNNGEIKMIRFTIINCKITGMQHIMDMFF